MCDFVFEKLNSFRLLAAFVAICAAPRHFFRRLPLNRRAKHSVYVTPGFFLTHLAALTTAFILFVYPRMLPMTKIHVFLPEYASPWINGNEKLIIEVSLLIFCFTTPLWIVPLSLLIYSVRSIFIDETLRMSSPHASPSRAIYERSKPVRHHRVFLVPLNCNVYRFLNWNRYLWGLCYFGLFGFVMLHLIGFTAFATYRIAIGLFGVGATVPLAPIFTAVVAVPVIFAQHAIVRPYAELLRAARKVPTMELCLADCEDVEYSVALSIAELQEVVRLNNYLKFHGLDRASAAVRIQERLDRDTHVANVAKAVAELIVEWAKLKRAWKMQQFDLRDATPSLRQLLVEQRTKIVVGTIRLDTLEDLTSRAHMPEPIVLDIKHVALDIRAHLALGEEQNTGLYSQNQSTQLVFPRADPSA
jgi:hypothetical protein